MNLSCVVVAFIVAPVHALRQIWFILFRYDDLRFVTSVLSLEVQLTFLVVPVCLVMNSVAHGLVGNGDSIPVSNVDSLDDACVGS